MLLIIALLVTHLQHILCAQDSHFRPLSERWAALSDEGPSADRWDGYTVAYDTHLRPFVERSGEGQNYPPVRMLEIGVQSGGSIALWKNYFAPGSLVYVGFDNNPLCEQLENKVENIFIEIGDQVNSSDLSRVCLLHGPFDVILDDGGHTAKQMVVALRQLFPACLSDGGVYAIEDT